MSQARRLSVRSALSALSALWALILLGWLSALALGAVLSGDLSCKLVPGSSIYGEAEWRLARLGTVCLYDLQQPDVTLVEAPRLRWVVTALLLLWGVSLLCWRTATRSTLDAAAA